MHVCKHMHATVAGQRTDNFCELVLSFTVGSGN